MKKSTHAFINKYNNDTFIGFNNLIFEPVLLAKDEADALINEQFSFFSMNDISLLTQKGLIVREADIDKEAEKVFIKNILSIYDNNEINLLYIIPTNTCNLACTYCFIGQMTDKKITMSNLTIENIVSKYSSYLIQNYIKEAVVIFYGAEPLLGVEIIDKIIAGFNSYSQFKITYNLITNGTLIDSNVIEFLSRRNISLGISIDGPQNINDINRIFKSGVKSVYKRVEQSIALLEHAHMDFNLSITITENVLINPKEYIKWLKSLNIKNISFNLLHFSSLKSNYESYYTRATDFIVNVTNELAPFGFIEDRYVRKADAFYNHIFKFNDCAAIGAHQLCISPQGDVTVCHGYWNTNREKCGNINECTMEDILINKERIKWRNYATIKQPECIMCPALFICGRGCIKQSEDLFGDKNLLDKGFCIHTKLMLDYLLNSIVT